MVARADGDLMEVVRSAINGHGINEEGAGHTAEAGGGIGQGDGGADERRGRLEVAAHVGDRLFAMVGNGHMIAVLVDHDGLVRIGGLGKGSEHGNGLGRAAKGDRS